MRLSRLLLLIAPLMLGAGCSRSPIPAAAPLLEASAPAVQGPAAADTGRVNGAVLPAGTLPPPSALYGQAPVASGPAAADANPAGGDVSLNFADTDIRTVTAQILGTILHQTYTIDPSVQGTATLQTASPLPRAALIPTLQTLLAQNHAVLITAGGVDRVMLASDAGAGAGSLLALRYADAADLAKTLQPYVAGGGKIIPAPGQNAVLIEGDPATQQALAALVEAFDVDALAGQSYELFPVSTGAPQDFAAALSAALGRAGTDTAPGAVTIVPMVRIGAVLVIAKTRALLSQAERVYAVVNQMQRETVRSWHVYYLQNGRANDAAYVLQQAFTPDAVTAQPTAAATGQTVSTLSDQAAAGAGGTGGAGGLLGSSVTSAGASAAPAGGPSAQGTPDNANAGAAALLGPLSSTGTVTGADTIRVIPDNQNNALLIYGTAAEDDEVNAMLAKLDIAPLEVRIDATIAEVDLDSALQYGTQFFFKSGDINAALSTGSSAALDASFPGFVLSGAGADAAPLAISALQAVTKVRVLSSPELMVLDGQAASLQVGNLVPYLSQTSQSTTTAGAPVINSIDYRETGVILQVTPHVGSDGLVTLDVAQEVSGVEPNVTTAGVNSPTFSERAVTSRVAIQDGQTIGLAGLISDSDSHENSGIPFLKNIPLLGALVSTQNNQRSRTELLVLITPHVIRTQGDAAALTADLREALPQAAGVPGALRSLPAGSTADPDAALRARLPPGDAN